jgi:hypothetical protein
MERRRWITLKSSLSTLGFGHLGLAAVRKPTFLARRRYSKYPRDSEF